VHLQLHLHPDWAQADVARALEPYVRAEGLNAHERYFQAEFEYISFRADAAYAGFEEFADQDDWYGRMARQRRSIMEIRAFEDFEALELNVAAYHAEVTPSPEFLPGLAFGESALCTRSIAQGQASEAADYVVATLSALPKDAPYGSINLLWSCFAAFEQTERTAEVIELAETFRDGLGHALSARQAGAAEQPAYDAELFENQMHGRWWHRSLVAPENYLNWRFERVIGGIDRFLECRRDGIEESCP